MDTILINIIKNALNGLETLMNNRKVLNINEMKRGSPMDYLKYTKHYDELEKKVDILKSTLEKVYGDRLNDLLPHEKYSLKLLINSRVNDLWNEKHKVVKGDNVLDRSKDQEFLNNQIRHLKGLIKKID